MTDTNELAVAKDLLLGEHAFLLKPFVSIVLEGQGNTFNKNLRVREQVLCRTTIECQPFHMTDKRTRGNLLF